MGCQDKLLSVTLGMDHCKIEHRISCDSNVKFTLKTDQQFTDKDPWTSMDKRKKSCIACLKFNDVLKILLRSA